MTTQLDGFSLLDDEVLRNPRPFYSRMRTEQPIFVTEIYGQQVWMVTTDELCREVLRSPGTYSSQFSLNMKPSKEILAKVQELRRELNAYPRVNTLITADPPAHDRFRKLVAPAFTPRFIDRFKSDFSDIATDIVQSWGDSPSVEIRSSFGDLIALRSIVTILGIEDKRIDDIKRWSHATVASLGATITEEEYLDAERGVIEFHHYLAEQIELRRQNPRDDMITRLLQARLPAEEANGLGTELAFPEILDLLQAFLVAGNHTTARALTELVYQLATHPDVFRTCCEQPDARPAVIEEALRLASPAQSLWRRSTEASVLGGVDIPAGAKLLVMFASANRDESVYPEPDEFRPGRDNGSAHLSFGRGVHFCIGAPTARAEIRAALDVLCNEFSAISVSTGKPLEYERNFVARGLTSLWVDLKRRE